MRRPKADYSNHIMCYLRSTLSGAVVLLGLWSVCPSQEAPKTPAAPALQTRASAPPATSAGFQIDDDFIHQEFGDGFALIPASKPYFRDIDGDGVDDLRELVPLIRDYWAFESALDDYLGPQPDNPELKVGRNDPCPCGSGKKYKKCHGA